MDELPKVKKKKKIDIKKFVALAKRVKRSFEEEEKYIRNEDTNPFRISSYGTK